MACVRLNAPETPTVRPVAATRVSHPIGAHHRPCARALEPVEAGVPGEAVPVEAVEAVGPAEVVGPAVSGAPAERAELALRRGRPARKLARRAAGAPPSASAESVPQHASGTLTVARGAAGAAFLRTFVRPPASVVALERAGVVERVEAEQGESVGPAGAPGPAGPAAFPPDAAI